MSNSAIPWTAVHQTLHPWDFPDKNTGVSCHFLLQGTFLTQGSNLRLLCLLQWQADSLPLNHQGSSYLTPINKCFQIKQLLSRLTHYLPLKTAELPMCSRPGPIVYWSSQRTPPFASLLCPWRREQALMYLLHKYLSKSGYAPVYLFERVIAYLKLIA